MSVVPAGEEYSGPVVVLNQQRGQCQRRTLCVKLASGTKRMFNAPAAFESKHCSLFPRPLDFLPISQIP